MKSYRPVVNSNRFSEREIMPEEREGLEISIEVTEEQDCRRVLAVEVARGHLLEEKEHVVGSLAKEVSVPGFRKGKAPLDVIRARFGELRLGRSQ